MSEEETKKETKKVTVNLELDANLNDNSTNPFMSFIHLAKAVDAWRIFPRIFLTVYIILLYKTVEWYMQLAAPTMEQSALISVVVGAGAAWFGLYIGSGGNKKE